MSLHSYTNRILGLLQCSEIEIVSITRIVKSKAILSYFRSNFKPSKYSVLCHEHFESDQLQNEAEWRAGVTKLRLKAGAVPTVRNKRHRGEF